MEMGTTHVTEIQESTYVDQVRDIFIIHVVTK